VAVFFSSLLCNVYACDGSHVFAVDCETAVAVGSLELIPKLSMSLYLETFKEPRNRFQGTRKPRNQGTRNQELTLRIGESRGVADSQYRGIGESPTPRIGESGSRYLIYNKLQNFISQKITKLFEQNFQRVF
jgi:hypothetical protein